MTTVAYPRAEIEQTFVAFRDALGQAMRTGDWSDWARFYTEDAVYVEHAMGTFRGRRAGCRVPFFFDHTRTGQRLSLLGSAR